MAAERMPGYDDPGQLVAAAAVRRRFRQALVLMNRAVAASGLSTLEYHLLLELGAAGRRVAQIRLADSLSVPQPRVSSLIKELAGKGLVSRRRGSGDRRLIEVGLTPKGRSVLFRANDEQRRALAQLVTGIPPGEFAAMIDWGAKEYLGVSGQKESGSD